MVWTVQHTTHSFRRRLSTPSRNGRRCKRSLTSHTSLNRHLTLSQLFVRQESQEADILTGNALYFRMHDIKDVYFVGGFGTVQWIDVEEYTEAQPDAIVTACTSAELQVTLSVLLTHCQHGFIY